VRERGRPTQRLVVTPTPQPSCRDTSAYPTVRDRVRCVVFDTGHGDQWATWDAIAWRESRYDPYAISWTGCCYGIFQEHSTYWGWLWSHFGGVWSDEITNTLAAMYIYDRHGFGPWGY
jgi:hypothetical protein